jgi:hypothetical protein
MSYFSDAPLDRLWREYSSVFRDFDDLTLARWLAQTLGQLSGQSWRLSHPLIGAYRLAAQLAHERQIWHKRLVALPMAYQEAPCCRAPLLPLLTRDVVESGLTCQHCSEACVVFDDLPSDLQTELRDWSGRYSTVHAVAHWDDAQIRKVRDYDGELEKAARDAEQLLLEARGKLVPRLLEMYPAVLWEDQDECLEVRPEDVAP